MKGEPWGERDKKKEDHDRQKKALPSTFHLPAQFNLLVWGQARKQSYALTQCQEIQQHPSISREHLHTCAGLHSLCQVSSFANCVSTADFTGFQEPSK